jgi:hypothetical protein
LGFSTHCGFVVERSNGGAAPEALHLADLSELLGDLLELLEDLLLLLPLLDLDEFVEVAHLLGGPALDLGASALDIGYDLHILFKELLLISEGVLDSELGIGGGFGGVDAE